MRTCSISDCGNRHEARGWCNMHYTRWQVHGDPMIVLHSRGGPRLPYGTQRVDKEGYVKVKAPGHPTACASGWAKEHRMKWHDLRGPIPKGMIVHHRNENRADNRIRNLRLMTQAEHNRHHHSK